MWFADDLCCQKVCQDCARRDKQLGDTLIELGAIAQVSSMKTRIKASMKGRMETCKRFANYTVEVKKELQDDA